MMLINVIVLIAKERRVPRAAVERYRQRRTLVRLLLPTHPASVVYEPSSPLGRGRRRADTRLMKKADANAVAQES